MLPFGVYFVYAYVLLPLAIKGTQKYLLGNPQICPVLHCMPELVKCLTDVKCKDWLNDVKECDDEHSHARQQSAAYFSHVQHPHDVAFCRYRSFDRLESANGVEFLSCMGKSECLEQATYSDTCASVKPRKGLSFGPALSPILKGRWRKLYSTGWDLWPCQWTDFHRHKSTDIAPEPWMEQWPHTKNVWRMDLYWKNSISSNITFHMSNEMYPRETWQFDNIDNLQPATLKTRAVMWGTEAHENWYLIDHDKDLETITVYYCAYTEAVDRYDSIAMILQKESANDLTEEQHSVLLDKAKEILGPEHGKFQRIGSCS